MLLEFHGEIERRLTAECGKHRIGPLHLNHLFQHLPRERFDVRSIGRAGVRHDRGWIGVHQHHAIAVFPECLAGLRSRIVKLTRLTNDDGTGAYQQNRMEVVAAGHGNFQVAGKLLHITIPAAAASTHRYNLRSSQAPLPANGAIPMPIATPALDLLSHALPDELKDIRLNLSSVLGGENLQSEQALGIALSAAHFLKSQRLSQAIHSDILAGLGDRATAVVSDAVASAGLMAMNTVYYRFRHMIGKESYATRPARLRMSRMAQPTTDRADFELMSLGCAALAGCEACIQNHEASLVDMGTSEDACHDAIRIAAVISATACGLMS